MRCDRAWTMVVTLEAVKQHRKQTTTPKATRNHSYYPIHAAWLPLILSPFLRFRNTHGKKVVIWLSLSKCMLCLFLLVLMETLIEASHFHDRPPRPLVPVGTIIYPPGFSPGAAEPLRGGWPGSTGATSLQARVQEPRFKSQL